MAKDFGRYSDPLADPRGAGYTAIGSMDTHSAKNAADHQRARDEEDGVDTSPVSAKNSASFSSRRVLKLLILFLIVGPIIFVLFPIAGVVYYVVLFAVVIIGAMRSGGN